MCSSDLLANNCLLKAPAGSPFITECSAVAMGADQENSAWGDLGPALMTVMVRKHGLEHLIAPPLQFSPLGWWEFPRLVEDMSTTTTAVRRRSMLN